VLLLKPRPVAEHEATGRAVLKDVAGLNQLSENLLLLNQIGAGHYRLASQTVSLDEVVFQAVQKLQARHPAHRASLQFDPQINDLAEPLAVAGDPGLLALAFLHLLDNGGKFSPTGQVRVRLGLAADYAVLRVENDGPGISTVDLARLSEPFFRGDNVA
jgi:signal transduction histidine kinase